jgi:hypothetical protein
MNLPDYTAECSLYKSNRGYLAASTYGVAGSGAVIPALTRKNCNQVSPNCMDCTVEELRGYCGWGWCESRWVFVQVMTQCDVNGGPTKWPPDW